MQCLPVHGATVARLQLVPSSELQTCEHTCDEAPGASTSGYEFHPPSRNSRPLNDTSCAPSRGVHSASEHTQLHLYLYEASIDIFHSSYSYGNRFIIVVCRCGLLVGRPPEVAIRPSGARPGREPRHDRTLGTGGVKVAHSIYADIDIVVTAHGDGGALAWIQSLNPKILTTLPRKITRRGPRSPKYHFHKTTGQACVRINGHDIYLGKYRNPKSEERYRQVIADWSRK